MERYMTIHKSGPNCVALAVEAMEVFGTVVKQDWAIEVNFLEEMALGLEKMEKDQKVF
jgi:hypothetical protein